MTEDQVPLAIPQDSLLGNHCRLSLSIQLPVAYIFDIVTLLTGDSPGWYLPVVSPGNPS